MESIEERELLLVQLAGYLEELRETGVDELYYAPEDAVLQESPVPAVLCPDALLEVSAEPGCPEDADMESAAESAAASMAAPDGEAAAAPVARTRAVESPRSRPPKLYRAIGKPSARLFLVMNGEGFQGEAGDLLINILKAMGFNGKEVCLLCFAAVPPATEELRHSLLHAITTSRPEAVVLLGAPATRLLLQDETPIQELRGRFFEIDGIQVMPTLHPEALLHDPSLKRPVWEDMQQVMRLFGKTRD